MGFHYQRAIVGGTFDRFHRGHKKLLETAFAQSEQVVIGVATAKLYKHKFFASLIEDYETRFAYIKQFIAEKNVTQRVTIVPLNDIYGNSLTEKDVEAIFITESNLANVQQINKERVKRKFIPLEIVQVPYVLGNDGKIITSERIRKGEIDRRGNSYSLFFKQKILRLPKSLRHELRLPIGSVTQDVEEVLRFCEQAPLVIAVGDIVALSMLNAGRQADLSIIDHKTRRYEHLDTIDARYTKTKFTAKNDAGTIMNEAVTSLQMALDASLKTKEKQLLVIEGEEDLLAIPAILLSPLTAIVIYGQMNKGMVMVQVSEKKKEEVASILQRFQ